MIYEAWRISYQSSEQAARTAWGEATRLRALLLDCKEGLDDYWVTTEDGRRVVNEIDALTPNAGVQAARSVAPAMSC